MDNKIIISVHGLYISNITTLVRVPVYPPPPPLEGFIVERCGSNCPDTQPNPLHLCQTPMHVYHFSLELPLRNFRGGGDIF